LTVQALGKTSLPEREIASVRLLGAGEEVTWERTDAGLTLPVPETPPSRHAIVYQVDFLPRGDP